MKIKEDSIAAWHDSALVVGKEGDGWNDASTQLFDGQTAQELAVEYEAAGRLGCVDGDGFITLSFSVTRDELPNSRKI